MYWDFPSHKNVIFLTMHMKYLTFLWWNKTSVLAGQPSTSHWQKAPGEGEEDL
jgi:hypothetical protein